MTSQKEATFFQKITYNNYIVRDHQVYGIRILPGVALLDMIYRLATRYFDDDSIELRQILFKQPVVVSENFDKSLCITFSPEKSAWRVTITSNKVKDNIVFDNTTDSNLECLLFLRENLQSCSKLDVANFINSSTMQWDMDNIYGLARKVEIQHDIFMKTLGIVYQRDNEAIIKLHLSDLAEKYREKLYAHPAFLDGSTLAGLSFRLSEPQPDDPNNDAPYVPFMIGRFCIYRSLPKTIYTYTKKIEPTATNGLEKTSAPPDLIVTDITILDESGEVLVEFDKITAKRIRNPHLIRKLAEDFSTQKEFTSSSHYYREEDEIQPQWKKNDHIISDFQNSFVSLLQKEVGRMIRQDSEQVDIHTGFYDLGLDSTQLLGLVKELEQKLGIQLYPTLLFEYSNIQRLAEYLRENHQSVCVDYSNSPGEKAPVQDGNDVNSGLFISLLQKEIGRMIRQDSEQVDIHTGFYDLGLDSTQLLGLVKELERNLNIQLYPTLLFEYSTIQRLADYLRENHQNAFLFHDRSIDMVGNKNGVNLEDDSKIVLFEPVWRQQNIIKTSNSATIKRSQFIVIIDYLQVFSEPMKSLMKDYVSRIGAGTAIFVSLSSNGAGLPEVLENKFRQLLAIIQKQITQTLTEEILFQIITAPDGDGKYAYTLAGLLKTAYLENPKINSQVIDIEDLQLQDPAAIVQLLEDEAFYHERGSVNIDYKGKPLRRYIQQLHKIKFEAASTSKPAIDVIPTYKDNGVYVITGGLGGLGILLAKHIATQVKAKIVLIGRSDVSKMALEKKIGTLMQKGAELTYLTADIGKKLEVAKVFQTIKEKYGLINGIFHCAGVIKDQFIIKKDLSDISQVFAPKVQGLWNIDEITGAEKLDFLVIFSSTSAILGSIGQADYATANSFMDILAMDRQEKAKKGLRYGQTLTVNWPFWTEGGMQLNNDLKQMMYANTGLKPLPASVGLHALDVIHNLNIVQSMVVYGDESKICNYLKQQMLFNSDHPHSNFATKSRIDFSVNYHDNKNENGRLAGDDIAIIGLSGRYPMADNVDQFYQNLKTGRDCISGFPKDRWRNYHFAFDMEQMYKYGGFVNNIAQFDPLFFNISPRHAEVMDPQARLFIEVAWEACEDAGFLLDRTEHFYPSSGKSVGVFAGVFWSLYELFGAELTQSGFPTSFGTSPASIANMVSYCLNLHGPSMAVDTMCSSSLTAIHLASESIRRRECDYAIAGGVNLVTHPNKYIFLKRMEFLASDGRCRSFGEGGDGYVPGEGVGAVLLTSLELAEKEGYPIYGVLKGSALNHVGKTSGSTVPDPIAQSEVIIGAIKKAGINPRTISYIEAHGTGTTLGDPIEIQGLNRAFTKWTTDKQFCAIGSSKSNIGHLEAAAGIAGLTKLLLQFKHQALFPSLHSEKMNPYIPFENTAFYVQHELRSWKQPVIDIHGDKQVYPRRAGLSSFGANGSNAHLIIEEYIGKGKNQKVFAMMNSNIQLIPLSAKNPERLKAYAQKMLDFLRSKNQKPEIDFKIILKEMIQNELSIILNKLTGIEKIDVNFEQDFNELNIDHIQLSQLYQNFQAQSGLDFDLKYFVYARSIWDIATNLTNHYQNYLEKYFGIINDSPVSDYSGINLTDLAYTFQTGREAMECRVAFIVKNIEDLISKLQEFVEDKKEIENCIIGEEKNLRDIVNLLEKDEDSNELIKKWIIKGKIRNIAGLWVKGIGINWELLYPSTKPRHINLPVYPFALEYYWVPEVGNETGNIIDKIGVKIHPLLQQNVSDLSEQRYSSIFTGQEFFLKDHVVKGRKILPGVAYLEMARAAVAEAAGVPPEGRRAVKLKNVVWARPIVVDQEPVRIYIGIYPEDADGIAYEIYGIPENGEVVVYSRGSAILTEIPEIPSLDVKTIQAECDRKSLSADEVYGFYKAVGLDYGPSHRGIETIYVGQSLVLAQLSIPVTVIASKDQFVLHPSVLDAALQAAIGMGAGNDDSISPKLSLPFALQELEVYKRCTDRMWAFLQYGKGSTTTGIFRKLDIDLCDEQGHICVRMKGFSAREQADGTGEPITSNPGSLILESVWKEQAVIYGNKNKITGYDRQLVIICELNGVKAEDIETGMNGARILSLQTKEKGIEKRFRDYAVQVFEEIQKILADKLTGKVLIQILITGQEEQQLFAGLSGILKTAQLENPNVIGQLIELEITEDEVGIISKLNENSYSPINGHIRYQEGKRLVPGFSEISVTTETVTIPWKDGGVYLFTGGAGGLGMIFAKEIAEKVKGATLILSGRSPLNVVKQTQLQVLESLGANVTYRRVDVSDQKAVINLVENIGTEFGKLDGILHSAGIIRDNFIIKKSKEEFLTVLSPKVAGVVNLDVASKDLRLDFMIIFSSLAGVLGNIGQVDYAAANSFLDAYAGYRNELIRTGQRHGRTLSINWPLWQEGGMQVNEAVAKIMRQNMGMTAMQTKTGIRSFYGGIASGRKQVLVIEGDLHQIRTAFSTQTVVDGSQNSLFSPAKQGSSAAIAPDELQEKTINHFKKLLSPVIKLPVERIEADTPFEKYGIDSIMVMDLTNQLEQSFGSLSKTLFFEYQTIRELTGYFLKSYHEQINQLLGVAASEEELGDTITINAPEPIMLSGFPNRRKSRFAALQPIQDTKSSGPLNIAIIGVSGRYPQARNLNEFWQNLREGKDCITEIPKERWDYYPYFDEDKNKLGKTYSKWGGFLEGVDWFDPLFFNISPREAEIMDPQERLFLECVYETLEDAGYTRETLGKYQELGLEGNVGVYVGVMYEEYQLYGAQAQERGYTIALSGNPSSIANRVSYFCNFHGPSIALDTMCSSSLTAIHLACQSIQRRGCELAIAGGVNISIHPNKYLMLGQGKFVSGKGRCESFGRGGDGYVPGEGVGAILLKPLSKAIADCDHIYGIIKGTAINHGGKTNGYSVPNPNAQAGVIGQALREAGIDSRTVSYIEAHGTGTSLGDPIEITGLVKAFQKYTDNKQFCTIGSAKSNIGHCESAAGISGVTKVLLQLKNRKIAPSLHSEELNPNIDFSSTPFIVQQELAEWERPIVIIDGVTKEYPRIAGISSFGAGGSNAHVVIEEYIPQERQQSASVITDRNQAVIVLSAKNGERLKEQAQRLLIAIKAEQFTDDNLADIAYTLQVGREAMEERLGFITGSIKELAEKLAAFVAGKDSIEDLYHGQVKRNQETLTIFTADEEMREAIQKWIERKKLGKLLALWVKGLVFDFVKLYGEKKPCRISLPAYPFARERYWVPEMDVKPGKVKPVIPMITKPSKIEKTVLIKDWQLKELTANPEVLTGAVLVLGTEKTIKLALSLFQDLETVKIILIIHGESEIITGINTDFYTASAGEALYRQVKEDLAEIKLSGIIDLTAYDEEYEQSTALESGKLTFLQKLIENDRQQGLCLMQVTYRLNQLKITKTTMQGARLAGLYRMLGSEYQQIRSLTMDTDSPLHFYKKTAKQIQSEFLNREREVYSECCYRNESRFEPIFKIARTEREIQADSSISMKYRPEEVVLITGGSRGIGQAIAGHIVSQGVKNLIIIGREELPKQSEWREVIARQESSGLTEKLKQLQSYVERGVKVGYYSISLSDETEVRDMLEKIHLEFGPITGVFHCAGTTSKVPIFFEKSMTEIETVCEPKISGLVTLHRVLAGEPLNFFILFSSISGIVPTLAVGQSDYATANAYMDYYTIHQSGQGKTYLKSLQWPAWGETGMAAGRVNSPLYQSSGLISHSTADGLMLLDVVKQNAYTVCAPCVMIPDGFTPNKLLQIKPPEINNEPVKQERSRRPVGIIGDLRVTIRNWLEEIFITKLKLDKNQWDSQKTFDEYGVDSIILAQLVTTMQERVAEPLDPSLLLQFRTLDELVDYFLSHHGGAFGEVDKIFRDTERYVETENNMFHDQSDENINIRTGFEYSDIAIIGIACRFPGSPDKEAYWDLLTKGIKAIKPVPEERWSKRDNRMDYGGWIDKIDLFDAKFFNINDTDAAAMDPQARIILEESLKAIYDAGYEHKELSGKKIGIYIGGRLQTNHSIETILQAANPIVGMGQNYIATNISRFFNFTGPSMVVDTACSSGLTGLSLAVESLQSRRIEMALAGAVNLLNQNVFELFAARNILSKNGEFHIFEKESEGEVLGEGAGVVILKRLDDAIRDRNRIYGVVKAIAVNNDGRTIGPGSPNINAQKQVMKEALALSGKNIGEIGYIEVNGGGSPVVDAVEIKSIAETYRLDDKTLGQCYLGSIKPNIGHLLLTSGMAELIRCVLSVYYKRIPPFLSAGEPFPYYGFGNSRILFNREAIIWEVPTGQTRVAALNSFPDGGTNCHVIIEEFIPDVQSYQSFLTPKELPVMDRKTFKVGETTLNDKDGLPEQESGPDNKVLTHRKLESLLSGLIKEPSKSKDEKSGVFATKWGEYDEF